MTSKNSKKVQIRLYPYTDTCKQVKYRVDPTELNWFQRIFCNYWRTIYEFCDISGKPDKSDFIPLLDKPGTINSYKDKFKTLKDIKDFEQIQLKKYNNAIKNYRGSKSNEIEY